MSINSSGSNSSGSSGSSSGGSNSSSTVDTRPSRCVSGWNNGVIWSFAVGRGPVGGGE